MSVAPSVVLYVYLQLSQVTNTVFSWQSVAMCLPWRHTCFDGSKVGWLLFLAGWFVRSTGPSATMGSRHFQVGGGAEIVLLVVRFLPSFLSAFAGSCILQGWGQMLSSVLDSVEVILPFLSSCSICFVGFPSAMDISRPGSSGGAVVDCTPWVWVANSGPGLS